MSYDSMSYKVMTVLLAPIKQPHMLTKTKKKPKLPLRIIGNV